MDFLFLNLYLGIVSFSVGSTLFVLMLKRTFKNWMIIVSSLAIQFAVSFILSLLIWRFWIFDFDIMCGPVSLPAALGETTSILLFCIAVPRVAKQINKGKS